MTPVPSKTVRWALSYGPIFVGHNNNSKLDVASMLPRCCLSVASMSPRCCFDAYFGENLGRAGTISHCSGVI